MPWGAIAGAVVGGMFANKAAKTSAASADYAAQLAYEQSLPWDVSGLFGEAQFDEDGRAATLALSPELQAQYDALMARSAEQAAQVDVLDPDAVALKHYEYQKGLFAPQEEQERLALENRLIAQGLMGASGGALQTQALHEAQAMKDLARQAESMTVGQQFLDMYRTREMEDRAEALKLGALPYDYGSLGRGIGSGMSSAAQAGMTARSQAAAGLGATQAAFGSQLGKSIAGANWGGLFGSPSTGGHYATNMTNPYAYSAGTPYGGVGSSGMIDWMAYGDK